MVVTPDCPGRPYGNLNAMQPPDFKPEGEGSEKQPAVWVLVGSMGAMTAARRFFDRLSPDRPLAFVFAIRIDPQWTPQLQTPPFPEYTSGHSVISGAAAIMLTKLFGAQFSYADNTEVEFGLPVRHFTSFEAAAQEAAISRFYGGIHYMPAIENGMTQGKAIASFMLQKIATRTDVVVGR